MPRHPSHPERSPNLMAKIALAILFIMLISAFIPLSSASAGAADVPVIDLQFYEGYGTPFAVENIKPGDMGAKNVILRNAGSIDGQIAIWVSNVREVDFAGDGAYLDEYLFFEVSCEGMSTNVSMPCSIWSLPGAPMGEDYIWALNVRAGQTVQINWVWEFNENYKPQNEAQGDSLSFDINYLLGDMPPPNAGMSWIEVNVLGRVTKGLLDSEGKAMQQVVATDETRSVALTISEATPCLSADGQTIRRIEISQAYTAASAGSGLAIVSPVYSISAFISPMETIAEFQNGLGTLRINYDPGELPSITETIGIYMNVEGGSWQPLWIPADAPILIGQGSGSLNRSGSVAVIATYDPMNSAYFLPSDLGIDPSKQDWWDPIIFASRIGEVVRITVLVTNVGQVSGQENVTLTINGQPVGTEQVVLGPMESQQVTFDLYGLNEGDYEVEVSGLSGSVTVGTQVNWWLIILVSSIPIAVLVAYAYSARRYDEVKRRMDALQSNVTDMKAKLAVSETASAAVSANQNVEASEPPKLASKIAPSPAPSQINETMAAYVASSEPMAASKDDIWIGDSFNQVDKAKVPGTAQEPSPILPPIREAPKTNGKSLEEAIAIEDSIQFEEEVGSHQLKVAKEFVLAKVRSQGTLVIDEAPSGENGLIAMAALNQLVEEGKLRAIQEKRRTVYMLNEP